MRQSSRVIESYPSGNFTMRTIRPCRICFGGLVALCLAIRGADRLSEGQLLSTVSAAAATAMGQDAAPTVATSTTDEFSEEELQQIRTADRFLGVLEKNPRRGTALDRVYGHHVEFGSLDRFLQDLTAQLKQQPADGAKWMLLGLLDSQRGADAAAVDAFRNAETHRPDDALASYYLGQSLLRIGESEAAVTAFETALEKKPSRADLLEIFQQLGRVHQRAQRTDDALTVWQRLEALFPDDPRVLEQIAVTLAEEGQPLLALPRYERLIQLVQDDYRRVMFQISAAEMKIKSGEKQQGITDLEQLLTDLNPDGWLYRDVRRRIENVYLRSGDQDSLVKYYEAWLQNHTEDVEAMARLARFLATSARVPEAAAWMEKALKLAPSRTELRKAFIDQLVDEQRIAEAIQQYQLLLKASPGNTDFLRDWGRLVLKDKQQPEDSRRTQAAEIWNQILATRPDDALTAAQVADLFRQNNLLDDAERLYRRAVELSPNDPQYREYLGEFLHIRKHPDEALQIWSQIAEGTRRNVVNVTRLAEILHSFGYAEQAMAEIAAACQLDPKDFSLQIRAAEYHSRAANFDAALGYITAAEALAANDDEHGTVLQQQIEILQAAQRLDVEADRLSEQIQANTGASAGDWYRLARFLEAGRRWPEATAALEKALQLDDRSLPALTAAARIAETSGNFSLAADNNRRLAEIDRRSRGDHLMSVARLEAQLGRADAALQAAQNLIVSSPGNTDSYEFFAQMCFRLGKADEGLDALRKAVRINPNEPHLIMALGAALAEQLRTDESIELYWRAFEKSDEVEDKVGLTMKLVPLYQQINQFDKLIERLERDRREEEKRREMTICLAQAWRSAGDSGTARQELESLLSEDTRDTNLLNQLAKLCQESADLDAAISYQRQLVAVAPGHETEFPLSGMLMAAGHADEAREILVRLTQREEDPVRLIRSIDSMLTQGHYEAVIQVTEPLLSQQRSDWELLYREGVAWASLQKTDEATNRFERILSLMLPYDSLGSSAEARLKQSQAKARSDNLRGITTAVPQRQSALTLQNMSSQVQTAVGLVADNRYYGSGTQPPIWVPEAYGVARMAAYGWLLKFTQDAADRTLVSEQGAEHPGAENPGTEQPVATATPSTAKHESIFDQVAARAAAEDASREAIYDQIYLARLNNELKVVFEQARRLARAGGREEQIFFLSSLNLREVDLAAISASSSAQSRNPSKSPLGEDDLQLMMECYEALGADARTPDPAMLYGGNVAYGANGQVYVLSGNSYVLLPGVFRNSGGYLTTIVEELRLSGKADLASKLLNAEIAKAVSPTELTQAMALLLKEERLDELPETLARWHQSALKQIADTPVTAASRSARTAASAASANVLASAVPTVIQWMGKLGPDHEHAQILSILDSTLQIAAAEARHRQMVKAAHPPRNAVPQSSSPLGTLALYYGKENLQAVFAFPPANDYCDRSAITLLRQTFEVFQRNEVTAELVNHLRQRADKAPDESRMYERLYLAAALWWAEEQDEAVTLMAQVSEQIPQDVGMQFQMAAMYESRGDFEDALQIVDAITARDQQLLQRRETEAIQLAERLGDTDRARTAAERLFGLRLNATAQLQLVERMRRLGMHEMADSVMTRVERSSGNQVSSLASLMMLYQGQGRAEQAGQLAHMLLRRTAPPVSSTSGTSRNPLRIRTTEASFRSQALQLLARTGELKTLIEQLESQLQRSPDSLRLYDLLIEYYGATDQKEKVGTLLEQAIDRKPDAYVLRMQLARHLEQTGKHNEACDQYLQLIRQKPEWIIEDLYQVRNLFQRAQRTSDLLTVMQHVNLKKMRSPHYLIDLVSQFLREGKETAIALNLLERIVVAFPTYRRNILTNVRDEKLWQHEQFYLLGKKMVLPSPQEVSADPWFGIGQIYSYSANGNVTVVFHQMLQGIGRTNRLPDFERSIHAILEHNPGWHGGQVMLAMIEFQSNRKQEARQRLETLIADEAVVESASADACWVVGQELEKYPETQAAALKIFERALSAGSTQSRSQLQYSPITKLIRRYSDSGRQKEARDLLLSQLRNLTIDQYDAQYSNYLQIENRNWAAGQLLSIGYPVDAIRIYQQSLRDREGMKLAANWNGNAPDYYSRIAENGFSKAMSALDPSNTQEALRQLLETDEVLRPGNPALDLMLIIPATESLHSSTIESPTINLLVSISSDPEMADAVVSRLQQLRAQFPSDISIGVTLALFQLKNSHPNVAATIQSLSRQLEDNPLEVSAIGGRPSSRQRREAALSLPLWLVAREILSSPEHGQAAVQLAERALTAARMQPDTKSASAILYDWGQLSLTAGQREFAESKWSDLLDLSTERPRKKQTSNTRPDSIPPLSISQFRTTIMVAEVAARHGMVALSQKAVRESVSGGMPVPDPPASGSGSTIVMSGGMVTRQLAGTAGAQNAPDVEASRSLQQVIRKWNGELYPAAEVVGLLTPIILPADRPKEIRMIADSSDLLNANVSSLAEILVQWAQQAGTLDELEAQVTERGEHQESLIESLVILTSIAIRKDQADTALRHLQLLADKVKQSSSAVTAQLACHAALPASEHKLLQSAAFDVLLQAQTLEVQNPVTATNSESAPQTTTELSRRINQYLAATGDEEMLRRRFDEILLARQKFYSRYSGDYGLNQQWNDFGALATEAARIGMPTLALDFMGRAADFRIERYSRPSMPIALATVSRHLQTLSPEERYNAWYNWTMPTDGRNTVRFLSEYVEVPQVPQVFLDLHPAAGRMHDSDLLSNLTELAAAAADAGKLDELRQAAGKAADQNVPQAQTLQTLILIQQGDAEAEPAIEQLLDTIGDRSKVETGQPIPDLNGDYLVFRECLKSGVGIEGFRKRIPRLNNVLQGSRYAGILSGIRTAFAERTAVEAGSSLQPWDEPALKHWFVTSAFGNPGNSRKHWWAAHHGQISRLAGPGIDLLYLACPVEGDFQFTVDCYDDSGAEGDAGYGGLIVQSRSGFNLQINTVSSTDLISRPRTLGGNRSGCNKLRIQSTNGMLQYYLNHHLVYQERRTSTSPWITLCSSRERITSFRNPRFSGNPVIPDEVVLLQNDRMDGWSCSHFGESQPRRRLMSEKIDDSNNSLAYSQRNEPTTFDWETKNGILTADAKPNVGSVKQSWIHYHRPLQDQESFRYEFLYVPGQSVAHPTIGRLALMLEPQGVSTHWITTPGWDDDFLGIPQDNKLVESAGQRSAGPLPLEPGAWNTVELKLNQATAILLLNGRIIFERPLEPILQTHCGLFRHSNQNVKVRNAVLTGPWRQQYPDLLTVDLLEGAPEYSPADYQVINAVVPPQHFEAQSADVVKHARTLAADQAYEYLKDWVLPSTDHSDIRLAFRYLPLDEQHQHSPQTPEASQMSESDRLLCPAVELVRLAKQLDRLPELNSAIQNAEVSGPAATRNQLALHTLVRIAADDLKAADTAIAELYRGIEAGLPKEFTAADRLAEYLVARQAAKHPELWQQAADLAIRLRALERDTKTASEVDNWKMMVNALVGQIEAAWVGSGRLQSTTNQMLSQWQPVPYLKPDTRAWGLRPSTWSVHRGAALHFPGETWEQLFFQSPLRGKFEITAQRSTHGHKEVAVAWGMHSAEPRYDLKATRVVKLMHGSQDIDGQITLPVWDHVADFRIVVDGRHVTTFTNGVKIHEEHFAAPPDPWLVLQTHVAGTSASVRNLRITGTPEIPSEIDLIDIAGWASWRADMYGDWFSESTEANVPYIRSGDEIVGQLRKDRSASPMQSLLMYQRPMLEDGEIEFETYYIPGESEVHPALGRSAFLIRAEGVHRHYLTDAQFESTDLPPDNESPISDSASSISLKAKAWNHLLLRLKDDQLTLIVNGEEVASVTVDEAPNERFFGLFRYSDRTSCRVRNLRYRGEWPKTLPPVSEQQLAYPEEGPFQLAESEVEQTVQIPLNRSLSELQADGIGALGPAGQLQANAQGTQISLSNAMDPAAWPGLQLNRPLTKDCEITLDFSDLELAPPKTGWGAAFSLTVRLDDTRNSSVECSVAVNSAGTPRTQSMLRRVMPDGKAAPVEQRVFTGSQSSGGLRLVRRGGQIHCLICDEQTKQFRLLESYTIGNSAIKSIEILTKCSDSVGRADVVARQLILRTGLDSEKESERLNALRGTD